jgi:hypothetical protein
VTSRRPPDPSHPSKRPRPPRRQRLDESPTLRPISLRPPELVELNAAHERQALDALAELLADHLERLARRDDTARP